MPAPLRVQNSFEISTYVDNPKLVFRGWVQNSFEISTYVDKHTRVMSACGPKLIRNFYLCRFEPFGCIYYRPKLIRNFYLCR